TDRLRPHVGILKRVPQYTRLDRRIGHAITTGPTAVSFRTAEEDAMNAASAAMGKAQRHEQDSGDRVSRKIATAIPQTSARRTISQNTRGGESVQFAGVEREIDSARYGR